MRPVTMTRRWSPLRRAAALTLGLASMVAPAQAHTLAARPLAAQDAAAAQRYVVAGASGATLSNLPDPKGQSVLKVEPGTPLAVLGSAAEGRYLKVQAPGGVQVWVYGKYLEPSERIGWMELTGSYVNMRPRPRSQNSWPLGQLDRGERLFVLQRQDPSKPLAEDWVQVYSPATTAAYVLAAETAALPEGSDGAGRWRAAASALGVQRVAREASTGPGPKKEAGSGAAPGGAGAGEAQPNAVQQGEAATTSGAAPADVYEAIRIADARMEEELAKPAPDFLAILAGYETALAMNPDAPTRTLIEGRMNEATLARELADLRREAQDERAQRERELKELRSKIARLSTESDPLWGRFVARGWLETERVQGERVYRIRFGSETVAEVQCLSGRYDLEKFVDYEIGLRGMTLGNATRELSSLPVIDVDRIEVISARLGR